MHITVGSVGNASEQLEKIETIDGDIGVDDQVQSRHVHNCHIEGTVTDQHCLPFAQKTQLKVLPFLLCVLSAAQNILYLY